MGEWHSSSFKATELAPVDRPHAISYLFSIVIMSLSCAVSTLTLICQNFRRYMTLTMPNSGGCLSSGSIPAYKICSRYSYRNIRGGVKFKNGARDSDHAPFRDGLPSSGWDLLWPTCVGNSNTCTKSWFRHRTFSIDKNRSGACGPVDGLTSARRWPLMLSAQWCARAAWPSKPRPRRRHRGADPQDATEALRLDASRCRDRGHVAAADPASMTVDAVAVAAARGVTCRHHSPFPRNHHHRPDPRQARLSQLDLWIIAAGRHESRADWEAKLHRSPLSDDVGLGPYIYALSQNENSAISSGDRGRLFIEHRVINWRPGVLWWRRRCRKDRTLMHLMMSSLRMRAHTRTRQCVLLKVSRGIG